MQRNRGKDSQLLPALRPRFKWNGRQRRQNRDKRMKSRKPNRLKGYDYAQLGYYYVTMCTKDRAERFGDIQNGEMILNKRGKIVFACWNDLTNHYANIQLDAFVIMPNHIHGIIVIHNADDGNGLHSHGVGNGLKPFPTMNYGLSEIIRGFKTFSSRKINDAMPPGPRFHWQKSFHDHVIRNKTSLNKIRDYIINNPLQWAGDM